MSALYTILSTVNSDDPHADKIVNFTILYRCRDNDTF